MGKSKKRISTGDNPGDHVHKMFKDGFFNPKLKHFNYAMGCPDELYPISFSAAKRDFAARSVNLNSLQ